MSYCVNCGVELEPSLTKCPLCNTPVINPHELEKYAYQPPYPTHRGQVDVVKRKDFAILTLVVLIATALSCLLLNIFIYTATRWSLFIIGACLLIFVFLLPAFIKSKLPSYICLLFDSIAVGIYLFLITFNTTDNKWFLELALPIIVLITILLEIFTLLLHIFPVSFIAVALYVFLELAFLCVGLELLIEQYIGSALHLSWSAIVLTVCSVITIALITLLSRRRLREAVRRRLHF